MAKKITAKRACVFSFSAYNGIIQSGKREAKIMEHSIEQWAATMLKVSDKLSNKLGQMDMFFQDGLAIDRADALEAIAAFEKAEYAVTEIPKGFFVIESIDTEGAGIVVDFRSAETDLPDSQALIQFYYDNM
jgi:hypothetical protein